MTEKAERFRKGVAKIALRYHGNERDRYLDLAVKHKIFSPEEADRLREEGEPVT